MKKIVLMLLSVVMAASLTSCGDNEEPTPKSNNYVMLYRVWCHALFVPHLGHFLRRTLFNVNISSRPGVQINR